MKTFASTIDLPVRGAVAYQWTGNGPETIVLLNGSVFNYHQWDGKALPILTEGLPPRYRILQYDYVGIGGSSAKSAPFSMVDLAGELRDLLDALSVGSAHLLGISKGSMVGQAFLFRHPERAKSFCGLGNPNMLSEDRDAVFEAFRVRLHTLHGMKELWPQRIGRSNHAQVFNRLYVPVIFGKPLADLTVVERLRAALVRRMVYPALESTHIQTIVDLFAYFANDIGLETPIFAEGLPTIGNVPILLLNGIDDTTTPVSHSRELVQLLAGAELVEFEGVTHMGPMLLKAQARPVFERYVKFIKGLGS